MVLSVFILRVSASSQRGRCEWGVVIIATSTNQVSACNDYDSGMLHFPL